MLMHDDLLHLGLWRCVLLLLIHWIEGHLIKLLWWHVLWLRRGTAVVLLLRRVHRLPIDLLGRLCAIGTWRLGVAIGVEGHLLGLQEWLLLLSICGGLVLLRRIHSIINILISF